MSSNKSIKQGLSEIDEKTRDWGQVQNDLKSNHDEIAKELEGQAVAYVDYPVHFNVGDLLIYHGTEKFFRSSSTNVVYRSDIFNVSEKALNKVDTIVFHGGGNFGDLYPKIHEQRMHLIEKFQHKKIVVLPQSVHFKSESKKTSSKLVLSNHKNLVIYVRDLESYQWLQGSVSEVKLMPDMAHSLFTTGGELKNYFSRTLTLRRCDIEGVSNDFNEKKDTFDWKDVITKVDRLHAKLYRALSRTPISQNYLSKYWYYISGKIIARSESYFNQFDVVDTDRLHGLIFANLLGKHVIVRDNNYGKNSKYYNAWLKGSKNIELIRKDD